MKYMQNGGFQNNPLMKLTLNLTLLFLLGFWVSNFFLFISKMGWTPSSVAAYYIGSEAQFTMPRTFMSMLEVTHAHLPIMAIVILLLTHLVIFAPLKTEAKILIIVVSFLSALLNEASGWLIRFVSPHFALLKLLCFWIFQAMLIFLITTLGWFLWISPSQIKGQSRKSKKKSQIQ